MNKKLVVLIVALECVFSVFLISLFGPMIEALHAKIGVQEIYFVTEDGERIENGAYMELESDDRFCHITWRVLPDNATTPDVRIVAFSGTDELTEDGFLIITPDDTGNSARLTFRERKPVRIVLYATDGSGTTASISIDFAVNDEPSDIDPFG